ncbi:RNA polymerase III subunit E [Arctopsyche grandis]|uniref:RNA polymerase III subunit E n=1 Tax=Arctopsyche grandis TaxID=121162 RepID=UPI00406D866D
MEADQAAGSSPVPAPSLLAPVPSPPSPHPPPPPHPHPPASPPAQTDAILQEIPVFLSQTLAKQLYIFQYPVKSAKDNWNDVSVLDCKIKPVHQQVKLEFGLDTDNNSFDTSRAEQIAMNTDGIQPPHRVATKEKEKNIHFKSGIMDKIQYESTIPVADISRYTIAVLQEGELHITPINGILQMRPAFNYFDKQDKRVKDEDNEKKDIDDEAGPSSELEATQITVSFARNETDRIKKAREKSYSFLTKKSSEEPWCDSTWWHPKSDKADLERHKLFASATTDDRIPLNLDAAQYLSTLVPQDIELNAINKSENVEFVNLSDIKKLPPTEQCKIILNDAKLITVGWISSLIGLSGAPLLTALAGAGRLLSGGRWAARSSLVYPPGSVSQHSGISDQLMCRARDYVLYLFTKSQYVDRRKVAAAVKLPSEEVKEILSSVARFQPEKGWELFIPPDPDFDAKYPDVVQRQTHFWDARQKLFNEMLSGEQVTLKRQRKKSQRDSCSSDGGMPSPKVRHNSVTNHSQVHRDSVGSDNESGGDSKKINRNKNPLSGGSCGKRTKHSPGGLNSFNFSDNHRVS